MVYKCLLCSKITSIYPCKCMNDNGKSELKIIAKKESDKAWFNAWMELAGETE